MALGGGTFTAQNKILPGAYINFVSLARASVTLADRGVAAMPFVMDWGPEEQVLTLEREDFAEQSLGLLGYPYNHAQMQALREVFRNAKTLRLYRLNSGAAKAANEFGAARWGGSRGNALTVTVAESNGKYTVATMLEGTRVDSQTVESMDELADNDFIVWDREAALSATAGIPLTGGSDGTGRTPENYRRFLEAIEPYSFNALGCQSDDPEVKKLFVDFTRRMREDCGVKFQTVIYRADHPDYEGIISVENKLLNVDPQIFGEFSLVYWVTGAAAGCAVNASNTNKPYDGEYTVDLAHTQRQLEEALEAGKFILHNVDGQARVLEDVNTLVTFTDEKGGDFSSNQTVRVLDQIAGDIAALFAGKYCGKIPNDSAGRVSLWNDIVRHHQELQSIRAVEEFLPEHVTVDPGATKKSVLVTDRVKPASAMSQLYMAVVVS